MSNKARDATNQARLHELGWHFLVVWEREFCGEKIKTDADDNTLMVLDFGDTLLAFVYGVAAGRVTQGYFGTKGSITAEGRTG